MLSDRFIAKRIKDGDIKAFEAVFKQYYHPLCMYAASLTGRMDAAEEIVQELFYICWRERERLPVFHSLKSYLYAAVRNSSFQYLEHQDVKNRYRETVLSAEPAGNGNISPQEQMEHKELQSVVNRTLLHLPERRQRIFRMHRFEGMKYAEIASMLSLSVKTVEAEMTKALQVLRKEIENYIHIT